MNCRSGIGMDSGNGSGRVCRQSLKKENLTVHNMKLRVTSACLDFLDYVIDFDMFFLT